MEMEEDIIPVEEFFTCSPLYGFQSTSSLLGSYDLSWQITLGSKMTKTRQSFTLDDYLEDENGDLVGWLFKPNDVNHPHIVTIWNR